MSVSDCRHWHQLWDTDEVEFASTLATKQTCIDCGAVSPVGSEDFKPLDKRTRLRSP